MPRIGRWLFMLLFLPAVAPTAFPQPTPVHDGRAPVVDPGAPSNAFETVDEFSSTCLPDSTALCLLNGRFHVQSFWRTKDGQAEVGTGIELANGTGYFESPRFEGGALAVRVYDACGFNGRFWVLAGGRAQSEVTVRVTDRRTGTTKEYAAFGRTYTSMVDTAASAGCDPRSSNGNDGPVWLRAFGEEFVRGDIVIEDIVQRFDVEARQIVEGESVSTLSRRRSSRAPSRPAACTYAVSPATQTIASTAGTGTIAVTADNGCTWTAATSATFLTITSGRTGYGNGIVAYSFTAYTGSTSRTANVTIGDKTVTITQVGRCTFTVTPTSKTFSSAGGSDSISVATRADCSWSATVPASATWITITGSSGTGNGTVSYSVAANPSTSSRSATMTVAGRSVTIRQDPDISLCSYATEYSSRTVTWCGGERTVRVNTQGDCPWTASSDSSWIMISLPSRSGSRDLGYSVAQNTTGSVRQATLTVAGRPVVITQNPRSGGGTHDGNWTGTTGSGRPVRLCVADGALQSAEITVRLDLITFGCVTPLIIQNALGITGNTFSGTFTTYPAVSNVFTTGRGTFTSASAMNGSWDRFSGSFLLICGSSISFGTGSILSSGTYTATKQP